MASLWGNPRSQGSAWSPHQITTRNEPSSSRGEPTSPLRLWMGVGLIYPQQLFACAMKHQAGDSTGGQIPPCESVLRRPKTSDGCCYAEPLTPGPGGIYTSYAPSFRDDTQAMERNEHQEGGSSNVLGRVNLCNT